MTLRDPASQLSALFIKSVRIVSSSALSADLIFQISPEGIVEGHQDDCGSYSIGPLLPIHLLKKN